MYFTANVQIRKKGCEYPMNALDKHKKELLDEERRAFEREEMESMQRINGHTYTSPYKPEKSDIDIILEHTRDVIREYQNGDADLDMNMDAGLIGDEILTRSNREMQKRNLMIPDNKFKHSRVKQLPPSAVAELIMANPNNHIRKARLPAIKMEQEEHYFPAIRGDNYLFSFLMKDGANEKLNALIRKYNPGASKKFIEEVYSCIRDSDKLDKVEPTMDEDLVPLDNGIWFYSIWEKTHDWKQAFISNTDPEYDKYTFFTKLPIDYDPDAKNPIIYNDDGSTWNVMEWIDQLHNRDGKHPLHTRFLFELIHCAVRVFTCFGMGVWFLDESKHSNGGQGKGTFCELLRGLVGANSCKNTEVYDLEDPKKLSGLERCNIILGDEASHHHIKRCGNYKKLQRGEPVSVKTLYKDEYTAVFKGLILHCLNEPLSFSERTGSVERTRVVLTWKTSYTDPASIFKENKKIKNDFVKRPEVLRYLLKYTLEEMNITQFSPECLDALRPNLEMVRNKTNAVAQFLTEHEKEFVWNRIPFTYLFQLFNVYYSDTHNQKSQYKLDAFIDDVALWANKSEDFEFHPQSFRPCCFMNEPEPLTKKYGLGYPWVREIALQRRYDRGERPLADCVPPHDKNTTYKEGGLYRKGTKGTADYKGRDWDESEDKHPAMVQFITSEYKDGKMKKFNIDPVVIEKSHFMINEQDERIILLPVNMTDTQDGKWPLEIDKKQFGIEYTKAELWLIPLTRVINEECHPIREAIASVTACSSEEDADKQQDGQA